MTAWLRVGQPTIAVRLRRHSQARRLVLRLGGAHGAPVLTCHPRIQLREAQAFLDAHEGWLRARLSQRPALIVPGVGDAVPVWGQKVRLAIGSWAGLDEGEGRLDLPGPGERVPAQAAAYLQALAREACVEAVERYAALLERPFGRITLRDTRARWGSCSSRGDLMFSWRLAMAPPAVLDYVAAHEVAHLAQMNHGPRFWAVVAKLCPAHAGTRDWLKTHGAALHRYDFRGEGAALARKVA